MPEEQQSQEGQEKQGVVNTDVLGAFKAPAGQESVNPEEGSQTEKPVEKPAEEKFTPSQAWSVLKEKFNVEMPEDVSAENEFDVLTNVINTIEPPKVPEFHPVAMELNQKLSDPEFKMDEWISKQAESINVMNLKGEDFLRKALPMEYPTATEEDIEEIIQEMGSSGSMKLQELDLKKKIQQNREAQQEIAQQQQQQQYEQALSKENERVAKEAEQLFAKTKNVTEIYGIPISEADRDNYNQVFRELITIDKQGRVPLQELLQSNEDVWKFAYVVLNGAPKIKEALFNAKEGTKAQIFSKLRSTPTPGPGKAAGEKVGSDKPNLDALKQPAGSSGQVL